MQGNMEGKRDQQFVSLEKIEIEIYITNYATRVELNGDSDCLKAKLDLFCTKSWSLRCVLIDVITNNAVTLNYL